MVEVEMLDLETALTPFEAPKLPATRGDVEVAVEKILKQTELDLLVVDDRELESIDTAYESRITYVVSLLKLLHYLRRPSIDPKENEAQAKLALGYIRHAETNQLKSLNLGRTAKDDKLAKAVDELRSKLNSISEKRAIVLAERKARSEKNGPAT